ncbi:hypothetical protein Tco_1266351 [Tanacetum coccineum]
MSRNEFLRAVPSKCLPFSKPSVGDNPTLGRSSSRHSGTHEADHNKSHSWEQITILRPSDEELEELMKDQLLPADASPIALSSGYISDSDPEEDDEEDQRRILLTILPTEETMMIMSHLMMTTMMMMSDCPELKNQNHENGGTGARGVVHALGGGETNQDHNDMEEDINA